MHYFHQLEFRTLVAIKSSALFFKKKMTKLFVLLLLGSLLIVTSGMIQYKSCIIIIKEPLITTLISAQPVDSDHHFPSVRVVGGTEVEIEKVPWQVSLQSCYSSDDSKCSHNCGGFIISENWIMTAGHCVMSGKMKARIGTTNNLKGGKMVDIKRSVRHEKYNRRTIDYDYALFELSEPLNFTDKVEAIALPSENEVLPDGTLCQLAGWGMTYNKSQPANLLHKLTHPIMNQRECADDVQHIAKLTPRMLCAGPKGDGKSGKYSIFYIIQKLFLSISTMCNVYLI